MLRRNPFASVVAPGVVACAACVSVVPSAPIDPMRSAMPDSPATNSMPSGPTGRGEGGGASDNGGRTGAADGSSAAASPRAGVTSAPDAAPGPSRGDSRAPADAAAVAPAGTTDPVAYRPPYDPAFALNARIPAGLASDPRSAAIVGQLESNTKVRRVGIATSGEVPTVYVASPSDRFYDVGVEGRKVRFRVPARAVAGSGFDHPIELLDPAHPDFGPFTELRLWQARIDHTAARLFASGSGLFHYNNDGAVLNPNGTKSLALPFMGAGTGSGLTYLAGLVRPHEVRAGEIRHAIRFSYSSCASSNQFRAPATKTDQPLGCDQPPAPVEARMDMGMRLQLDPAVDCAERRVPGRSPGGPETRFLRMFCRALQEYGMIVLDGTQPNGLLFYLEDDATAHWSELLGAQAYGDAGYGYIVRDKDSATDGFRRDDLSGIPWERLRVLASSVW